MGYTHYWSSRTIEPQVWGQITDAVARIIELAESRDIIVITGPDGTGRPEITKDLISLNGNPDHESLYIERGSPTSFYKTAQKPYDDVVTAILAVVGHFTGGAFEVRSDGDAGEWSNGMKLANEAVGSTVNLPRALR